MAGVAGTGAIQVAFVTTFVSKVTAPFLVKTLPSTLAPVVRVADVSASIFPLKVEFMPSVAEVPTCQKTLQACAPFIRIILLDPAVINVSDVLNIKTAFGSFSASSVKVPVIANLPSAELYVPAFLVVPPSSDGIVDTGVCPAAVL